jgi:hypothetical protein
VPYPVNLFDTTYLASTYKFSFSIVIIFNVTYLVA